MIDALLNNALFQSSGFLLASALWALAVGWFCWQITSLVTYPRVQLSETHPFEFQRRQELRSGNSIYRWFEPLVDEVAAVFERGKRASLDKLRLNLSASREKLPWRPAEFLAIKWVEGVLSGGIVLLLFWMAGWGKAAVMLGLLVAIVYGVVAPRSVADRAKKRLHRIRSRLPFAVDLIALTMEAGGGFQECLQTAVTENG
jgi:Flp pilus assembly protein TadB